MRERDAEVVERRARDPLDRRAAAAAAARARCREIVRSTALTNPVALLLPARPRQIHRIVHDRRRRHARQVQQLIGAEAQDLDDLRIEPLDRPLREVADQMIERRPPALHAGRDLGGQRAVALVGERRARARDRGRQIGAARRTRPGGSRRRRRAPARSWRARRSDRRPASSGWPARNSRAVIGRLPSAWSSTMSQQPVAGRHAAGRRRARRRSCPGGASLRLGSEPRPQQDQPSAVAETCTRAARGAARESGCAARAPAASSRSRPSSFVSRCA